MDRLPLSFCYIPSYFTRRQDSIGCRSLSHALSFVTIKVTETQLCYFSDTYLLLIAPDSSDTNLCYMPTESTGSFSSEQLVKDLLVFVL